MNPPVIRKQLILYLVLWVILSIAHFFILLSFYHIHWINAVADALIFNTIFALIGIGLKFAVPFLDPRKNQWYEMLTQHLTGIGIALDDAGGVYITQNFVNY